MTSQENWPDNHSSTIDASRRDVHAGVRLHGSCEWQRVAIADSDGMPTAQPLMQADCTEWRAVLLARQRHEHEPADRPATLRRAT